MAKKPSSGSLKKDKRGNLKTIEGKVVVPVQYKGKHVGHGVFMAAKYEGGALITGSNGVPLHYRAIISS